MQRAHINKMESKMRTDKYINRLIEKSQDRTTDPHALARMLEHTLRKMTETKVGQEAFYIVRHRIVRDAIRKSRKAA